MQKKGLKSELVVELVQLKFTYITVVTYSKLGHMILVTQPMLQSRPNWTELKWMHSYIQILCTIFPRIVSAETIQGRNYLRKYGRFQKCK